MTRQVSRREVAGAMLGLLFFVGLAPIWVPMFIVRVSWIVAGILVDATAEFGRTL